MAQLIDIRAIRKRRIPGVESLLAVGLSLGMLSVNITVTGRGAISDYARIGAIAAASIVILVAFLQTVRRRQFEIGWLAKAAIGYFIWSALVSALHYEALAVVVNLVAALLVFAACNSTLELILDRLRHALVVLLLVILSPAIVGQGFHAGRVWFEPVPGRYFGFANPDGLAYIAALSVLLALPTLRSRISKILFCQGWVLLILTASYTAAIATICAISVYALLGQFGVRASILKWPIYAFGSITVVALLWATTPAGTRLFETLERNLDLSGRTQVWTLLLEHTNLSDYFSIGLGNREVSVLTRQIAGVGTAHMTLLQMLISAGFITSSLFVMLAASVSTRSLERLSPQPTQSTRLVVGVIVVWFVSSLVSIEPGTALGFSLVITLVLTRPGTYIPHRAKRADAHQSYAAPRKSRSESTSDSA